MRKFIVGHAVCWSSQSQGRSTLKTGIVVKVVAPGVRPLLSGRGAGCPRNHESYVVEVPQGPNAKPRQYWPVVNNLHQAALSEVGGVAATTDDPLKIMQQLAGALEAVGGYLLSARSTNTPEWLAGVAERIRDADAALLAHKNWVER